MSIIVKSTSKGQITLPAKWRKNFSTNNFVIQEKGDFLEIKPLILEENKENSEYTVFDAIRDNEGRGIKAKDLLKIIKKTI
jgi:bifunctional DNA-binding transcriptional regulator/antitoxin component of YhaV-PrlF toxin-antitoxin module